MSKMSIRLYFCLFVFVVSLTRAEGNVCELTSPFDYSLWLPELFGDHMVLQRDQTVNIWGKGEANGSVELFFISRVHRTTIDESGHWKISLPAMKAGGPYNMEVSSGGTVINFEDIFIGDVWLASGQSNMAFRLKAADDADKEKMLSEAPAYNIRTYEVAKVVEGGKVLDRPDRPWAKATADNLSEWSAVAYYFARGLHDHLKVPIGIINCSQGASRVEAWMSAVSLSTAADSPLKEFSGIESNYKSPSVLYQTMLVKIIPYTLKGVIWYQGESNAQEPDAYARLFTGMIRQWRREWSQDDLPFLFVQLPGFDPKGDKTGTSWAQFREAQRIVAESVPDCGMAVIIDAGEKDDIHPKNKKVVGERLVLVARSVAYNEQLNISGPEVDRISFDGKTAVISYHHPSGLLLKGKELVGFSVCDQDGNWTPAKAKIKNERIKVSHREGKEITGVRYAWENAPVVSLYDSHGLPAPPFVKLKE